jgi:hypothetical protein
VSELRLEVSADLLTGAVEEAAEAWGGQLGRQGSGGELVLPVQAGLRHGLLRGRFEVAPQGGGSRLALTVDEIDWQVHRPAVAMLALGAAAAAVLVLWPFLPALQALLPLALVVAVGAWFLVIARLQNRGPEEFLALVEALAGASREPPLDAPSEPHPPGGTPVEQPPRNLAGEPRDPAGDSRPKVPRSWG